MSVANFTEKSSYLFVVDRPTKVYGFVKKILRKGNTVTYLTMSTKAELVARLSEYWADVGRHVTDGSLLVKSVYDAKSDSGNKVLHKSSNASSVRNIYDNDAVVVICPAVTESYIKNDMPSKAYPSSESAMVPRKKTPELEVSMNERVSDEVVVSCVYSNIIHNLELIPLLNLLICHEFVIDDYGAITKLSHRDILYAIEKGIDRAMGEGSAILILKTLQYIYGIDEDAILMNPSVWSGKLKKMCGSSANEILDTVTVEIKAELLKAE